MQIGELKSKKYYIAVFKSKNHAVLIHSYLNRKGYNGFDLISTPCRINVGCSYSIKFTDLNDLEYLEQETKNRNMPIDSIYVIDKTKENRTITKLKSTT